MKQTLTALLVIAVVVLAFLVGSYKTEMTRQQREKEDLETELIQQKYLQNEEAQREAKLDSCLSQADKDHWERWKLNCNSDIKKNEQGEIESCSVPTILANSINEERQTAKDNCFRRYGK